MDELWRVTYLKAIRALPEWWVHQDTRIMTIGENLAVVANPEYPPTLFDGEQWVEMSFSELGINNET